MDDFGLGEYLKEFDAIRAANPVLTAAEAAAQIGTGSDPILDTEDKVLDTFAIVTSALIAGTVGALGLETLLRGGKDLKALLAYGNTGFEYAEKIVRFIASPTWENMIDWLPNAFIEGFFNEGLNLDKKRLERTGFDALKTLDHFMAFSIIVPTGIAAVGSALKLLGANRISEQWTHLLGHIPESMGLNWVLGNMLTRYIELAVSQDLDEAINVQKRGNRPTAPEWVTWYHQNIVSEHEAREALARAGYQDNVIDNMVHVNRKALSISDLQRLYQYSVYDAHAVKEYLHEQGYSSSDRDDLATLYLEKIQTSASAALRSTAREQYTNGLMSREHYIAIMDKTHVPPLEQQDDLESIDLIRANGRTAASLSALRQLWQHGKIDPGPLEQRLAQLGYSSQATSELLSAWSLPPRTHMLTQSAVLKYFYSGVMDRPTAYARLLEVGLRAQDAQFLLDHPPAGGATVRKLTPSLVEQAYLAGAIKDSELEGALERAGAQNEVKSFLASVARGRYNRQRVHPGGTTPLTEAQVLDALSLGLIPGDEAGLRLENLGYSGDDATLLMEIKNKGPFQAPGTPAFASVDAAASYLLSLGFTIDAPPDPQVTAAEQMLESAGYMVIPPIGGTGTTHAHMPGSSPGDIGQGPFSEGGSAPRIIQGEGVQPVVSTGQTAESLGYVAGAIPPPGYQTATVLGPDGRHYTVLYPTEVETDADGRAIIPLSFA